MRFFKAPGSGQFDLPPSAGMQFFGHVQINGATGQELDTALGTMVHFTAGGVSYTVIGSVSPYAADRVARALAP